MGNEKILPFQNLIISLLFGFFQEDNSYVIENLKDISNNCI